MRQARLAKEGLRRAHRGAVRAPVRVALDAQGRARQRTELRHRELGLEPRERGAQADVAPAAEGERALGGTIEVGSGRDPGSARDRGSPPRSRSGRALPAGSTCSPRASSRAAWRLHESAGGSKRSVSSTAAASELGRAAHPLERLRRCARGRGACWRSARSSCRSPPRRGAPRSRPPRAPRGRRARGPRRGAARAGPSGGEALRPRCARRSSPARASRKAPGGAPASAGAKSGSTRSRHSASGMPKSVRITSEGSAKREAPRRGPRARSARAPRALRPGASPWPRSVRAAPRPGAA